MPTTDGQRLERAIKGLKIKKAHFALLADRTPVCLNNYLKDRKPTPEWVWLVVANAKTLSPEALKKKVNSLRAAKKKNA